MVKLAFALCLLVVVCGAEEVAKPHASNPIESWIADRVAFVQELQQKLLEKVANLEDTVLNVIFDGSAVVGTVIDNWKEAVEKIRESGRIGRECAASSIDLQATAQNYVRNATSCLQGLVDEIKADIEEIQSSVEDFTNTVSYIQSRIDECRSGQGITLFCIRGIYEEVKDEFIGQLNSLVSAIRDLSEKLANATDAIQACIARSAIKTLSADAAQSIDAIKKCVADANSE